MSRTVVILHPGGLGDLLLAVLAIQLLRERYSSHQLLLCGQSQAAELLHACGIVDRYLSVDSTACMALFSGRAPDEPVLRDWLNRCDLAMAWTRDDTGTLAATLRDCGAVTVIVESPFASTLFAVHQSERFAEIASGKSGQLPMASLPLPHALRDEGDSYLAACGLPQGRPLAIVHPGSGSRHKCVTPTVLLPVLEALEADGFELVLLEGPADHEMVERLASHMNRHPIRLSGLSVRLLAGVLARTDLFLGHDSGVTHLAALLGTPTVALFGPTAPARWAPRGPAVTVINGKPCRCGSWDAVKACLEKPCLEIAPEAIITACRTRGAARDAVLNPRIC